MCIRSPFSDFVLQNKENLQTSQLAENIYRKTPHINGNSLAAITLRKTWAGQYEDAIFDPDRCECNQLFIFNVTTHTNSCPNPNCKKVFRVLNVPEDSQSDLLSQKNQKSFRNDKLKKVKRERSSASSSAPKSRKRVKLTSGCSNGAQDYCRTSSSSNSNSNDRPNAYRRYLMQFVEDVEDIPEEVFNVLFVEFGRIHMLNSHKCRPTSIFNILRQHGFCQYTSQTVRIARMFNGEPVPRLSIDLINKLVARFYDVSAAVLTLTDFGKLPSFEILSHAFLRAEKREDQAAILFLNKGSVLKPLKLHQLFTACANLKEARATWNNIPHAIS